MKSYSTDIVNRHSKEFLIAALVLNYDCIQDMDGCFTPSHTHIVNVTKTHCILAILDLMCCICNSVRMKLIVCKMMVLDEVTVCMDGNYHLLRIQTC